jgi:hypothetical protein
MGKRNHAHLRLFGTCLEGGGPFRNKAETLCRIWERCQRVGTLLHRQDETTAEF